MDDAVYEEAGEQPANISVMETVASFAKALRDSTAEVEAAEKKLKEAKDQFLLLSRETIPQYFNSLGIAKLQLATGETVSVEEKLTCSQVKDEKRLKQAYQWLEAHDGSYLIKKKLEVEELDETFVTALESIGYKEGKDFAVREAVNTASLKSFLS
jgi:hypothetical protein